MKKSFIPLLALLLCLSMTGCDTAPDASDASVPEESTATTTSTTASSTTTTAGDTTATTTTTTTSAPTTTTTTTAAPTTTTTTATTTTTTATNPYQHPKLADAELQEAITAADEDDLIQIWIWRTNPPADFMSTLTPTPEWIGADSRKREQIKYTAWNNLFIEQYVPEERRHLVSLKISNMLVLQATKADILIYTQVDTVSQISLYTEPNWQPML